MCQLVGQGDWLNSVVPVRGSLENVAEAGLGPQVAGSRPPCCSPVNMEGFSAGSSPGWWGWAEAESARGLSVGNQNLGSRVIQGGHPWRSW